MLSSETTKLRLKATDAASGPLSSIRSQFAEGICLRLEQFVQLGVSCLRVPMPESLNQPLLSVPIFNSCSTNFLGPPLEKFLGIRELQI